MSSGVVIDADLQVAVDGHPARLVGSGSRLRLIADDPTRLYVGAPAIPGAGSGMRRNVAHLARLLDSAGLTLDVVGPRGVLVTLGHDQSSTVGRALAGSFLVTPGRATVVLAALRVAVRHRLRNRH